MPSALDRLHSDVRDLELGASGQHLCGVNVILLTPRICLGAASKPKSRAQRGFISATSPIRKIIGDRQSDPAKFELSVAVSTIPVRNLLALML